jgi:hypothetical protein
MTDMPLNRQHGDYKTSRRLSGYKTNQFPFMLTLQPPRVNTGQFPLKVPRSVDQSSSKMAVMRLLNETALILNFPQMTR